MTATKIRYKHIIKLDRYLIRKGTCHLYSYSTKINVFQKDVKLTSTLLDFGVTSFELDKRL